jgi:hypothetical protein
MPNYPLSSPRPQPRRTPGALLRVPREQQVREVLRFCHRACLPLANATNAVTGSRRRPNRGRVKRFGHRLNPLTLWLRGTA